MNEVDVFKSLRETNIIEQNPLDENKSDTERKRKIAEHKAWLKTIHHETPNPLRYFKVGVYIRYYNQTNYENYLEYHKAHFLDTISLCPNWEFFDFYIDEGQTAPHMENAPEWSRLLLDCMEGKVDLIITQKVSNVSRNANEVSFCSRLLASQKHPVGIYFIGENIWTLASYYRDDLHDTVFFPNPDWKCLPDDEPDDDGGGLLI